MFSYPLTLTFPTFSVTPQFQATDAAGHARFSAAKKLISSKDEINVTVGGRPLFKIVSQENRITDIPSNWDVLTPDGAVLGILDDDFISAVDTSSFIPGGVAQDMANWQVSRALNLRAIKMYWIKDVAGNQLGFVAPDKQSLVTMQLPLGRYVKQVPFLSRFITPRYYVQLRGQTVLYIEKKRTFFQDTYIVQVRGQFSEQDEPLLINAAILAVLYERERLKELYS